MTATSLQTGGTHSYRALLCCSFARLLYWTVVHQDIKYGLCGWWRWWLRLKSHSVLLLLQRTLVPDSTSSRQCLVMDVDYSAQAPKANSNQLPFQFYTILELFVSIRMAKKSKRNATKPKASRKMSMILAKYWRECDDSFNLQVCVRAFCKEFDSFRFRWAQNKIRRERIRRRRSRGTCSTIDKQNRTHGSIARWCLFGEESRRKQINALSPIDSTDRLENKWWPINEKWCRNY